MELPNPSSIYELKIFLTIVSSIVAGVGAVALWFIIRFVSSQDKFNESIRNDIKENNKDLKKDVDNAKNDFVEIARFTNADLRNLQKDFQAYEKDIESIRRALQDSYLFLLKNSQELETIKEHLARHEEVLYQIKSQK